MEGGGGGGGNEEVVTSGRFFGEPSRGFRWLFFCLSGRDLKSGHLQR